MSLDNILTSLNKEISTLSPPVPATLIQGSKIFILGEAPGKDEAIQGRPFTGASGRELDRMLGEAGIQRSECSLSNVFNQRPPGNEEEYFCVEKKDLSADYLLPALSQKPRQLFVAPKYLHNLERLRQEIEHVKPCVILALGKTALWAATGRTDLNSSRGFVLRGTLVPGSKVVATHHPARVLREWALRVIAVADFVKCNRESGSQDILYDKTQIWINPTLADLYDFERRFFRGTVACDIETFGGMIRCIGFAPSASNAIVVPLFSPSGPYWEPEFFEKAIAWVKHVVTTYPLVFHNGSYDISYLARFGIIPTKYAEDTLILHHSLYPELKKSLEFLGSYLANRPSWKKMKPRGAKTAKREE